MSRAKTRVLSVRLSLSALQSCFDLCEVLGAPTNGASSAIAKFVEAMSGDLRDKQIIPTYKPHELEALVQQFISAKNPTSMPSFEKLSLFETSQRNLTSEDFAPTQTGDYQSVCFEQSVRPLTSPASADSSAVNEPEESIFEEEEYHNLIEEKIREMQQSEAEDLMKKIMVF
jgi:hypothetical protein